MRHNERTTLLLLQAVLTLIAVVYGMRFLVSEVLRGTIFRGCAVLLVIGLVTLLVMALRMHGRTDTAPLSSALTAVLCLGQFGLTLFFTLPTRPALPAIALAWLGAAALGWRWGLTAAIAWSMTGGFMLYVSSILATPFDAMGGDMLPFIAHAIDVYRAGSDPYTADFSVIDSNPFFYPPLQWLIFLPVRALGLDLRLLNLLSAAAIVLLVEWHGRKGWASLRAGVYPIMLSPLVQPLMSSGQVWPYWLGIVGFALLVLHERWIAAAVTAALLIGLRQTALVPAAIVFTALAGRLGWRRWSAAVAVGAATLVVTVLPFVTSRAALRALLIDGPAKALEQAHLQGNPGTQIALSNVLDWAGLAAWDSRVEAGLVLCMVALGRLAVSAGPRSLLTVAGLGYALTVSANPYLHRYYYVAGFLLAAIGLTAVQEPVGRPVATSG